MTDLYTLDPELVEELIIDHMQEYVVFMNEVLALEICMGLDRRKAVLQVAKRYPQFNIN